MYYLQLCCLSLLSYVFPAISLILTSSSISLCYETLLCMTSVLLYLLRYVLYHRIWSIFVFCTIEYDLSMQIFKRMCNLLLKSSQLIVLFNYNLTDLVPAFSVKYQ